MAEIINGILIPFLGTVLGAACVFFLKKEFGAQVQKGFEGFAAGVMVAASFWSLLVPSIEQSEHLGKYKFLPAAAGLWAGFLFLLALDKIIPHIHRYASRAEGINCNLKRSAMLFLAVTLHNIPEGMAVGVVLAGLTQGDASINRAAAVTLSVGIALQNFPEGAIISLPMRAKGNGKAKSFMWGALSGLAEPLAACATFLLAGALAPLIPFFLSFAAGAMLFVVVEELITETTHTGTLLFAVGFTLMMIMDCVM